MTDAGIESTDFAKRMRAGVSLAWRLFARKVAEGLIPINKEASMQLHFAHVLQQLLPLLMFHKNETFLVELETGVQIDRKAFEVDVLLTGTAGDLLHRIAIELKCYRQKASSGLPRGATDIFMKDVYEDLAIIERYIDHAKADEGVVLVMNDLKRFVSPRSKRAKCWAYDISDGAKFGPVVLKTSVGGKPVHIELMQAYELQWAGLGDYWFLEVQGTPVPS